MFTEKIVDCFLSGTIPIYWGTKAIGKYFNLDGIITFESMDELRVAIDSLSPAKYHAVKSAIKDNYHRALNYRVAEDYIFETFPFLLP